MIADILVQKTLKSLLLLENFEKIFENNIHKEVIIAYFRKLEEKQI
jgi:hypothetical protein